MTVSHRICILSATFPPDICGVGDYTDQLARALALQGDEVTVLTGHNPARPDLEELAERVTLKRTVPDWTRRAMSHVLREIRRGAFDLVHIQYTPQFYGRHTWAIGLLPLWLSLRTGCRTIVTFHEIYTPCPPGLRSLIAGIYQRFNDTVLLWSSAAAIVTVDRRRTRLAELFPWIKNRVHAIPVGSGIPVAYGIEEAGAALRTQFGILPGEQIIGTFGALHTDKRYEALFQTIRRLLDRGCRIRGLMIGALIEGHPYWTRLKKCIADLDLNPYIIWTGFGTPADLSRWFALLDLYVMTDLRGASGRKSSLITALAHGLPVVATRGPDTSDDFVDGENIVLVDVKDETSLTDQIQRLLQSPEMRSRLSKGALRLHDEVYGWKMIAERTREVYRRYESGAQR